MAAALCADLIRDERVRASAAPREPAMGEGTGKLFVHYYVACRENPEARSIAGF